MKIHGDRIKYILIIKSLMFMLIHLFIILNRLSKDPRFKKLKCDHYGTYADDCIMNRVKQVRFFKEELI